MRRAMLGRARIAAAAITTTIALMLPVAGSGAAFADTPGCSLNNHCYATLRAGNSSSTQYQGMYGTWNRAAMAADCDSSHHRWLNSEMWFWPLGGGWVEGGHTAGWLDPGGSCDYYAFAAWMKEDGTGYSERMLARLDHNDAVTDEFQISRSSTTNRFYIYFNGGRVQSSNVQFWNSRRFQMGGEVATSFGTSHLFRMSGRAINAAGVKSLLPNPKSTQVDDPPLQASHPSNSEWTWRVRP